MRPAPALALSLLSLAPLVACAHPHPAPASTTTLTSIELRGPAPLAADDNLAAPAPTELPPMAAWAWQYPDAAKEIGQWALRNPDAARALARWELAHRDQLSTLVEWAVTHPHEPLGAFLLDRVGWDELESIAGATDDLRGFMAWIRRESAAARELALHPDGLAFAGEHARALARMSAAEEELLPQPDDGHVGDPRLPGEPGPLAPKDDNVKGGDAVEPPLE